MPTGYTADLHDGKEVTFEEFALDCARAFGALILMRDDPKGAPVPQQFEPNTKYHDEALEAAEQRMAELRAMSADEILAAHQAERADVLARRAKAAVERRDLRRRYESMLAEAEAWEPPTEEHTGLKEFMVQQLTESIRFDCGDVSWPEMPPEDPAEWFDKQVAKVEWDLNHHAKGRADEIERTRSRNEWLTALRESLGAR